jgi:hypothetical protein
VEFIGVSLSVQCHPRMGSNIQFRNSARNLKSRIK